MAKQFQVYLLEEDATTLLETVSRFLQFRIAARFSKTGELEELSTPLRQGGELTRVDCLLLPQNNPLVKTSFLEQRGCWAVDTLFSDVIEFSGCHYDGRTLKRGRLFYDTGFYDDSGQWVNKTKSFLDWGDAIFRVIKKSLGRDVTLDAYVGARARAWRVGGGRFEE